MVNFDASSRFTLVEQAMQNPGFDLITKTTVGPFVDTGLVINKFDPAFAESNSARVYISVSTLLEMAEGAGLFDELRSLRGEELAENYRLGYAAGQKENLDGAVRDLHDRLGHLLDRLADSGAAAAGEEAGDGSGGEPLILVVDVTRERVDPDDGAGGADEPDPAPVQPDRQSNGPRRNRRPSSVPTGASHGNPFRI